jgi:hypothetical protein
LITKRPSLILLNHDVYVILNYHIYNYDKGHLYDPTGKSIFSGPKRLIFGIQNKFRGNSVPLKSLVLTAALLSRKKGGVPAWAQPSWTNWSASGEVHKVFSAIGPDFPHWDLIFTRIWLGRKNPPFENHSQTHECTSL